MRRWVLEKITGKRWTSVSHTDIRMLESGRYVDPKSGKEVTFNLPVSVLDDQYQSPGVDVDA
jgi:hypothetical protein